MDHLRGKPEAGNTVTEPGIKELQVVYKPGNSTGTIQAGGPPSQLLSAVSGRHLRKTGISGTGKLHLLVTQEALPETKHFDFFSSPACPWNISNRYF